MVTPGKARRFYSGGSPIVGASGFWSDANHIGGIEQTWRVFSDINKRGKHDHEKSINDDGIRRCCGDRSIYDGLWRRR
jgi:hypothetical protein